jgi:hypothetical protein
LKCLVQTRFPVAIPSNQRSLWPEATFRCSSIHRSNELYRRDLYNVQDQKSSISKKREGNPHLGVVEPLEKPQEYYHHLYRHVVINFRAEYTSIVKGALGRRIPGYISSRRNYAIQTSTACVLLLIEKRLRTAKGTGIS